MPVMKFGETLYQRSVPKWAAYNLNYNELKRLIKLRTTNGAPSPVPIPGQSDHRWSLLEDEIFALLKEQYDNIGLFLRSKHGEIERRLAYLDKSVRSAKRSANLHSGRPSLQARKYQRLIQEAESIGEDVQALSRFAAVQKTAFRKILKKYRKWTGSSHLQSRMETEVFTSGLLDLNLTDQMQHISVQSATIKDLETALLNPEAANNQRRKSSTTKLESPVTQITKAAQLGPLQFDVAIASVPFGEAAGTACFWIHVDNLEEARVLLLRHMRAIDLNNILSRSSSSDTLTDVENPSATPQDTHAAYFDNTHRFLRDTSSHSPSKIAMSARWSQEKRALITMSDMLPRSDENTTLIIKRKELAIALDRNKPLPKERNANTANISTVKDFLSQHRDFKPLCELRCSRLRYSGLNNSAEVGTFAALDTNISFRAFSPDSITSPDNPDVEKEMFPHAVLQIRWEFGRKPEVVRAFETTHLAESVPDFTLETAAIHSRNPGLIKPSWTLLLEQDIRKVPMLTRQSKTNSISTGTTSGPSSTGESVFSVIAEQSAGSETSPVASTRGFPTESSDKTIRPKKKKARILAQSPNRTSAARYYSEYDDPDSELYQQEAYAIYVDPDAEAPGVATMKKVGSAISRVFTSLWPDSEKSDKQVDDRTPLLNDRGSQDEGDQSSDSDIEESGKKGNNKPQYKGLQGHMRPAERYRRRLSRRQRAFESTLIRMYSGLTALSYVFLLMSAIILSTGRKKELVPVDLGATVGVVMAVLCMVLSIALVYMRKTPIGQTEKLTLILADSMTILLGAAVVVGIVQKARYSKK